MKLYPSEAAFKRDYRAKLRSLGAYVFCPVPNGMGHGGVDDYVCFGGRFVAIEAKKPGSGSNMTVLQGRALEEVRAAGGLGLGPIEDWEQIWRALGYELDPAPYGR